MILIAIGAMDLWAMGLITVAMAAERLAPRPDRVARVIGLVAIAAGAWAVARALGA